MNRRYFLALSATTLLASGVCASDDLHVDYSTEVFEQAVADGKPFILDFYASW
jgi:thiol:disulfide interchange protein